MLLLLTLRIFSFVCTKMYIHFEMNINLNKKKNIRKTYFKKMQRRRNPPRNWRENNKPLDPCR
jgi:hypothetical protein